MLIISRSKDEKTVLVVNGEVIATLTVVHGERAKLGWDAPEHIGIYREEVWNRRRAEQAERRKRLLGEDEKE